ncbi:asparagine synthase B [Vibrio coralliilyticus]|uniref:asparagine synthase B n=1 Tax=Vibrio coralliilyticus TaxID=190893 RepID=UPI0015612003|nr:asparagine synthase B [Vibrio coralliilyticus]NRF65256.1 asparagine synthase B [Vibrio coralliilyticus]
MCGFIFIHSKYKNKNLKETALKMSKKIRHRGPDNSSSISNDTFSMTHERLSIIGIENGKQPIHSNELDLYLAANGEIYNHIELKNNYSNSYYFETNSDCEVIIPLFNKYGVELFNYLSGMYAFAIYDSKTDNYLIGRDPIGIIPLYYGFDKNNNLYVASEMKALIDICDVVMDFPPGHYIWSKDGDTPQQYNHYSWKEYDSVKNNVSNLKVIHDSLCTSIEKHMMCDVPFGLLLSGGLDSSIIASVAQKIRRSKGLNPLHSFAVGLKNSPDLKAAREVANGIGTIHHEVIYNIEDGINAIKDVIYHLETYDITTIRAATPMYLMARQIKAMGLKMVLSGEGSDELFGGYLYFHKAPNAKEFHDETVLKLEQLHKYDCLRSNKAMAAWGVESRVPFLDKEFVECAMTLNPISKMCGNGVIEKKVLREAFIDYLPDEILWRQKEQFSDGVGYSWIDKIHSYAETKVSTPEMERASLKYPTNTPLTKEGYLYRSIFESFFGGSSAVLCVPHGKTIACSTPNAIAWDESFQSCADPSGRAVKNIHRNSESA